MGKFLKQKKGITLIALVITIIVLLLLSGIAISMLSGNNSILQKAGEAKEKTREAEIKEKIQLAELSAMVNKNVEIDYDALKSALAKEFGTKGTDWDISDEDDNPWVVTVGNVEYEINGIDPKEEAPTPGLYYAGTDTLIMSWDEVIDPNNNLIQSLETTNGVMNKNYFNVPTIVNKNGENVGTQKVKLVVGPGVTTVGNMQGIAQLSEVILPDTVISLGGFNNPFLNGDLEMIKLGNGITEIPSYSFNNDKKLKKVILGKNVTKIGNNAFEYCINLQEINLPDTITEIQSQAFFDCHALTGSITLPTGLTTLGDSAFRKCTSLQSVVVNDGLTKINEYTFMACSSLESITIPTSITSIGTGAFNYECTVFKDVYYKGNVAQWNAITKGYQNDKLTSATIHENS